MERLIIECTRAEALMCVAALDSVSYSMKYGHLTKLTIHTDEPEAVVEKLIKAEAFDPQMCDYEIIPSDE